MEADGIHELTAAYALSALDPDDERSYEDHLRHCVRCREELGSLQEAAASLAYAVDTPVPPARLRERILAEARSTAPSNVVPLRRRFTVPVLAAAAAAAAGVAIGLGVWGSSLSGTLDDERVARSATERVLALFAESDASHFPVSGADGTLVVTRDGQAGLLLAGLPEAPEGKTYEVWVIEGDTPRRAGLLTGGGARSAVPLSIPVPAGATVAVTLEPAGGVDLPTSDPFLVVPTV
jgi:anti-sigma-K factor RskA